MKSLFQIISIAGAVLLTAGCGGEPETETTPTAPGAVIRNVTPMEAQQLMTEEPNLKVVDVRTPTEFNNGHIKGAMNIDFHGPRFNERIDALEKDQPYLLHCQSGGRSSTTLDMMKSMDFMKVYHLEGGIQAWKEAGNETVQ